MEPCVNVETTPLNAQPGGPPETLQARANLYALVARGFFDPTAELVASLADGSLRAEVAAVVAGVPLAAESPTLHQTLESLDALAAEAASRDPDATLHELKVEFARLFLGPGRPAVLPYETFYGRQYKDSSPTLMLSPEAESVGQAYRQAGVALANAKNEPTDHFATECEFVYYLCTQELASMARDDQATAALWQAKRVAFLDDHLARWYGRFLTAVEEGARAEFYRVWARLAAALIAVDLLSPAKG